jgi:hypothetical protein
MAMIASNEALKCMKKDGASEEKEDDCGDDKSCKIIVLTEMKRVDKKNVTIIKDVEQQGCDAKELKEKDHEYDPIEGKPGKNKRLTFHCKKDKCNTKKAMEKHLKAGAAQISFAVATIVLGVVINRLTL